MNLKLEKGNKMIAIKNFIKNILTSEYSILVSMFLGAAFALNYKESANNITIYGDIYFKMLQIAVIPLVLFTVSIGIYKMKNASTKFIIKTGLYAFVIVISSISISMLITMLIKPWSFIENISEFNLLFPNIDDLNSHEKSIYDKIPDSSEVSFSQFITTAIPNNIFSSLNNGNILQVVTASIIITFAAYKVSKNYEFDSSLGKILHFGFDVFTTINNAVVSLMPIGVFFIISNQFKDLDVKVLSTLGILMFNVVLCLVIHIIFYLSVIWYKSRVSFGNFISIFSKTFILLITTRSTIIALPSAISSMKKLNFKPLLTDIYLPVGSSILRLGTMTFFAIVTLFIIGIFDVSFSYDKILFILFSCIFAAVATAGTTGIISLQLISVVLTPLGLPLGGVMAILIAIDPIIEMFDTFANMMGNVAITALADDKSENNSNEQISNELSKDK